MAQPTVSPQRTGGRARAAALRVGSLDGVRAYGIVFVFMTHLDAAIVPGGWWGIEMFFALSAFLITGILLREHERAGRIDFTGFYLRRALRLLPALYLWVPFAILTAWAQGGAQLAKVGWSTLGSLFYFGNFQQAWTTHVASAFDQTWSLAVEEQFYFIWPVTLLVLLTVLSKRGQRIALSTFVVLGFAATTFGSHDWFLPVIHLLPLALGCWAAEQVARGPWTWVRWVARLPGISLVALAVCTYIAFVPPTTLLLNVDSLCAVVMILNLQLVPGTLANRFLSLPGWVWLGQRTYGIYLFGLTGMQLLPALTGLPLKVVGPLSILGTLVLTALVYRFVEVPVQRRGWGWYKQRRGELIVHAGP